MISPFVQTAEFLIGYAEAVVCSAHDDDDIAVRRNFRITVYESIGPVSSDGRTADSQVINFFRTQQLL